MEFHEKMPTTETKKSTFFHEIDGVNFPNLASSNFLLFLNVKKCLPGTGFYLNYELSMHETTTKNKNG